MEVLGGGHPTTSMVYDPGEDIRSGGMAEEGCFLVTSGGGIPVEGRKDSLNIPTVAGLGRDDQEWGFWGSNIGRGSRDGPEEFEKRWKQWEYYAKYLRQREQLEWNGECRRLVVKESGAVRVEQGCLREGCWGCAKWLGGEGGDVVPLTVQMRWVAEFFEGLYYQSRQGGMSGEVAVINLQTEEEAAYGEDPTTFPTNRRPTEFRKRLDVHTTDWICEDWFRESGITIGTHLIEEQRKATIRLLYTWRTSFVSDTKDIPVTDLVVHTIPTYAGIRAHRARNIPHMAEEEAWQLANLPPMLGLIIGFTQSPWVAKTTFVGKKDSEKTRDPITGFRTSLRMVHTYCALNRVTIKSNYPMKRMEPIINRLAKGSR